MSAAREQAQRLRDRTSGQAGLPLNQALLPDLEGLHLLVSVDTLNVGVHFSADDDPNALGHKALAVNLSDLAAMGAEARWVSLALRLPPRLPGQWFERFYAGFDALAKRHGVALIAMDAREGPLSMTVEALGCAPAGASLRRAGARPGDRIFVSGSLGDAAWALQQRLGGGSAESDEQRALQQRLDRPQPRLALGLALRGHASSAIDISDGLIADLGHIVAASGVGATVCADRLPLSAALRANASAEQALACALAGGDDYELCFTVPAAGCARMREAVRACGVPISEIGEIEPRSGVRILDAQGRELPGRAGGYEHFVS